MPRTRPALPLEVELYAPVKALLESQGYVVKAEVGGCDVVAVRGDEAPVIVELKRTFGLGVVLQGIDRLTVTDAVYVAVGIWPPRLDDVRRLLRRLGLGLIVVSHGDAAVVLDPGPYLPRRNRRRAARLLGEHQRRAGDPNTGGSTRRPIMTAYRQEAERCLRHLAAGPARLRTLRAAGDVPNAPSILRRDVYGWFERVDRGVYSLTPKGAQVAAERVRDGAGTGDGAAP
ncbi:MAG: DUF2161 family putative PD-(D/E)XK-type phosphodiesterase [Candidatus Limnocylindrales bacterium]